jgi:hypothetical protein
MYLQLQKALKGRTLMLNESVKEACGTVVYAAAQEVKCRCDMLTLNQWGSCLNSYGEFFLTVEIPPLVSFLKWVSVVHS